MAIHHCPQILPRLRVRYLLCHNHVNNTQLVQPNLYTVSDYQRLRLYFLQHWKMAFRWLHHLFLLIGRSFSKYQSNTSHFRSQLAYESRKAKKIIASRDISYAFTNVMANHYYSLRRFELLPVNQLLLIFLTRLLRSFLFVRSYQQLHQN